MKMMTMKMEMIHIYASMTGCILPLSRAEKADVVLHYIQLEFFSVISWIVAAERCLFLVGLYSNNFLTPEKKLHYIFAMHSWNPVNPIGANGSRANERPPNLLWWLNARIYPKPEQVGRRRD